MASKHRSFISLIFIIILTRKYKILLENEYAIMMVIVIATSV